MRGHYVRWACNAYVRSLERRRIRNRLIVHEYWNHLKINRQASVHIDTAYDSRDVFLWSLLSVWTINAIMLTRPNHCAVRMFPKVCLRYQITFPEKHRWKQLARRKVCFLFQTMEHELKCSPFNTIRFLQKWSTKMALSLRCWLWWKTCA